MREKNLSGYPSIDKPWLKYYSEEAINAHLPECSIYEYLWENNKDYPQDIAIRYFNKSITYRELFDNIDRCAKALVAAGVKPNDIVTVAMPSTPEALYAVYAINKIGAVSNMIHPLAGQEEIVFYLNEVQSKVCLMFTGTYEILKEAIEKTSVKTAVVSSPAESLPAIVRRLYKWKSKEPRFPTDSVYISWQQFMTQGATTTLAHVNRNCNDLALISHTGGTTGDPKGVMCSDFSINSLIYQSFCCFKHDERQHTALVVLPPFVNYSLIQSMLEMLYLGYTVILLPKYEPDKIWDYLKKYQPNVVLSIPAYWEKLIDEKGSKGVDLSCFEQIYYGGEAMSEEKENAIDRVLKRHGSKLELLKGLGSTELMAVASQTYPWCNEVGSVGIPLVKMNCKIVQPETLKEVRYLEQGEICFSGPTLMLGYYNNLEATDAIIQSHADGQRWLHTGDLGYMNEDGVIFVVGRIKRIIMTKGQDQQVTKMFPDRIEKVLNSHPAVQLSCVVGVPDEKRINYAKAVIELNAGYTASEKLMAEIKDYCCDKLPNYQIPDVIEFVAALPRTERGKIDYRALEEMAKEDTHHA